MKSRSRSWPRLFLFLLIGTEIAVKKIKIGHNTACKLLPTMEVSLTGSILLWFFIYFLSFLDNFHIETRQFTILLAISGGNGSALATYKSMNLRLTRNDRGETFEPMANIVTRLSLNHRPGVDKVCLVFFQLASITVKAKNLVIMILLFFGGPIVTSFF